METPENVEELDARVEKAYAAYVEAVGGTDESHRPLAPYHELHTTYRAAWRQALMAGLGPVTEAEMARHRPQGAQAPGGSPAGMTTGRTPAQAPEAPPAGPPSTPSGASRPAPPEGRSPGQPSPTSASGSPSPSTGTAPPPKDDEDDEESRQRGRGRK